MIEIRAAHAGDLDTIFEIINESARAYQGVIPDAAWHDPYMPMDQLQAEIASGVRFYCCDLDGRTIGVMGIQDVKDVTLVRHAYVRSGNRAQGIGRALLEAVTRLTARPVLIGAWKAATWAIQFYQKNGFTLLGEAEKNRLLAIYWTISDFQARESVVLADRRWLTRLAAGAVTGAVTGRMRLDCGKCIVRPWAASDKAALLRVAGNRNVWRNLTHRFPHPYTEADADTWFARLEKSPDPTNWAIEVDGVAVGGVGMDRGEGVYARSARFGYWLGEPYWGRGIMAAAVHGTVEHIFGQYDLVRLEAPVFEWNPSSMRVLEKNGFVREGVLRRSVEKDGQIIDAVLYARVRS